MKPIIGVGILVIAGYLLFSGTVQKLLGSSGNVGGGSATYPSGGGTSGLPIDDREDYVPSKTTGEASKMSPFTPSDRDYLFGSYTSEKGIYKNTPAIFSQITGKIYPVGSSSTAIESLKAGERASVIGTSNISREQAASDYMKAVSSYYENVGGGGGGSGSNAGTTKGYSGRDYSGQGGGNYTGEGHD